MNQVMDVLRVTPTGTMKGCAKVSTPRECEWVAVEMFHVHAQEMGEALSRAEYLETLFVKLAGKVVEVLHEE